MTPEQQEDYRKTTTDEGNKRSVILVPPYIGLKLTMLIGLTFALLLESHVWR